MDIRLIWVPEEEEGVEGVPHGFPPVLYPVMVLREGTEVVPFH